MQLGFILINQNLEGKAWKQAYASEVSVGKVIGAAFSYAAALVFWSYYQKSAFNKQHVLLIIVPFSQKAWDDNGSPHTSTYTQIT